MKNLICISLVFLSSLVADAQSVAINTDASAPNASAILDIKSIAKGLLIPRMTTVQRTAIATPAKGLMVFDISSNSFWFYNGSAWSQLSVGSSGWNLTGNAATNPAANFIGTTDNQPLRLRVNNKWAGELNESTKNYFIGDSAGVFTTSGLKNTSFGSRTLYGNTTGNWNTAMGTEALFSNTAGQYNTAIGSQTLYFNTADGNTANGYHALYSNIQGYYNTAIGFLSLAYNTGSDNTANGSFSLNNNITGTQNTANGRGALQYNTSASNNVAIGVSSLNQQSFGNGGVAWNSNNVAVGNYALSSNNPIDISTGINNTAIGTSALKLNITGADNTATGMNALYTNFNGYANAAIGKDALYSNISGSYNTALGSQALYSNNAEGNTANGYQALYSNKYGTYNVANGVQALYNNNSGSYNTANGFKALFFNTTGSNNTANGYQALSNNTIGYYNTANGYQALSNNVIGLYNTAIGYQALYNNISGSYNIAIGYNSGTYVDYPNIYNSIGIGNNDIQINTANQVIIGNFSTTSYYSHVSWGTFSDARIKTDIKEEVKGLDFIMRLKPVTYHKSIIAMLSLTGSKETKDFPGKYDVEKIKFSGFLAQEVEQAAKETGYDFSGLHKPNNSKELYALSYETFVVPLVKAIQEQQQIITAQQKQIDDLKDQNKKILAAIDQLIQSKSH